MNALLVDSSASNMIISARKGLNTMTVSVDMGMKQSEKILPVIDYVLRETGLDSSELDFMALCEGPGTFTGLRLGYSALKAISLAFNKPIYGFSTLKVLAHPFSSFSQIIIPVIDAKKNQAFAAAFEKGTQIIEACDTTPIDFLSQLKKIDGYEKKEFLVAGSISRNFCQKIKEIDENINISFFETSVFTTDELFELGEKAFENGEKPMEDYDGPVYIRKSEAEIVLESKKE